MRASPKARAAAWDRLAQHFFIQGADPETRPITQATMRHVLYEALDAAFLADAPTSPYQGGEPGFKGTETSEAMAKKIRPKADQLRKRVLAEINSRPFGATSWQIAQALKETDVTVKPRLSELKAKGLVRDSGRRGPSQYGNPSIVWISTTEGEAHVESEKA